MNFLNKGSSLLGDSGKIFSILKQFDTNGDGQISEDDFVKAIEKLGLGPVGEMGARQAFQQIDTNQNGTLEMTEALVAVQKIKSLLGK